MDQSCGSYFVQRLYSSITGFTSKQHFVRVTKKMKEDLWVWQNFLEHMNLKSAWQSAFMVDQAFKKFSDVFGSVGFVVLWNKEYCSN